MVVAALALAFAVQAGAQAPPPEIVAQARPGGRAVDFRAIVVPETVYVGQQATYQLGVFLDQDTRQRIRRNPEFQPPETRSLLSYDLREPTASRQATIGGQPYEAHVFRRALFPLTPGRYQIPQARLTYALPQTASFFSREENFTLRSEAVSFVAIEPPAAGRPTEWAGAVGAWRASARIDTVRGRAGEPLVLTMRIQGDGNVTLLPRPPVAIDWATVVNADERVHLDSTPSLLGGWKEFDWLVTPAAPGLQRVPALRYAFFNPRSRQYEIAESDPMSVRILAGDVVSETRLAEPAGPREVFAIDPVFRGEQSGSPVGWVAAGAAVLLAPLVALAAWVARRPRRPRPVPTPRERLESLRAADGDSAVRDVRRALMDGLRERTRLDPATLTAKGAWTVALRKAGVSAPSAAATEALIEALDAASFAATPVAWPAGAGWAEQAREALRIVDAEACRTVPEAASPLSSRAAAALAVVLATVLLAAPGSVRAQESGADAFAAGRTAYAGGDYLRASRHFADAARAAPRSVAAWSNYGAAAFLAGDTAAAVVGWQRALRLEPANAELRARLAQVRAPQDSGFARVTPVPAAWAVLVALLLWAIGWGVTARQCWRRRPAIRIALLSLVLGGSALAAAYRIVREQQGTGLAVVTAPAPLRAVPALGSEPRATPMAGEVAAIVAREGVWVHIRLDGNRSGWIPAERVSPLGGN